MTTPTIKILDNADGSFVIGEIEVADAYIYERINDKYTFDFTCYEQEDTKFLAQHTIIGVDNDFFRIAQIREMPVLKKYEVSCEHISYELNIAEEIEEDEAEDEQFLYEGFVWEIVADMLQDTRFNFLPSDDITGTYKFRTKTKGIRSQIIEFCKDFGFEAHFYKFGVAIQTRRGADNGLTIELGKNLKDLTIIKTFEFDGSITTSYDIDFIDLNKIVDENDEPLEEHEFHMGDTVHLKIDNDRIIAQRGVAVGYNPFRRELPTIELESPVKSITEVITSDEKDKIYYSTSLPEETDGINGDIWIVYKE